MNGKETEELTGISRRNLRFYEDQGLIQPSRNPENDYREYTEKDIEKLKIIRGLRTIDVPLDLIKDYLNDKISLEELSHQQELRLKAKQKEVETALNICHELHNLETLKGNTVDTLLKKMEEPEIKKNLFDEWKNDYKTVKEISEKEFFMIYPEHPVENTKDMTLELCRYADMNGYSLDIIKEGMVPEFILNGITYIACCSNSSYNLTSTVFYPEIFCHAKYPETLYTRPLNKKQKVMKFLSHYTLPPLILIIAGCLWGGREGFRIFATFDFWVIFVGIVGLTVITNTLYKKASFFHKLNEKTGDEK